jgi:hypothetical protein
MAESVVRMTPTPRTNDVIVFDAGDREFVVPFNPLACRDSGEAGNRRYQTTWLVWNERDRMKASPLLLRTLAMQLLDTPTAIPDKVERLLRPIIKSTPGESADRSAEEWDRFESQLVHWERHPNELEDEGLEPPNQETVPLIREVCRALRAMSVEPPLRLVPNCEAGAVLEWRTAPFLWSIEVERDGCLELSVFRTGRLITRYRIA